MYNVHNFDKSSDCCIVLCRNISFLRWSRTDEKWDNGKRTHIYTHTHTHTHGRKSINAISFTSVVRRRASENSSGTTIAQVSDYNLKAIMSFLRDERHICFVPFKSKSPRYTYNPRILRITNAYFISNVQFFDFDLLSSFLHHFPSHICFTNLRIIRKC